MANQFSITGLKPETIVSRLSESLGGRLAHNEDRYVKIGTGEVHLVIIRQGYKPTWTREAPHHRIACKASLVLYNEVQGQLEKGVICMVG